MSGPVGWLFDATVTIAGHEILWREIVGNLFGLASAVGGLRRKVWAWPVGIVGNVLLFTVFLGAVFDTPQHRKDVLEGLIQQRVLADETQRLHLTASDDAVRRALLSDPVISSLKKPDGSIDLDRYKELLAMQGMTPEQYDERVRYSLAMQQLPEAIIGSAFTPKSVAQYLSDLSLQQREVQGLTIHAPDFASKARK